ncbi:radical SAM protein [bacterium]|nr:radical SAM protein [bacterium]
MKHLYGPVPSRRLGVSLGLDIIPLKVCSLNCVYCQLGTRGVPTLRRRSYFPLAEFFNELEERRPDLPRLDYATFSGSGEPTLNADLAELIKGTRRLLKAPICVITNGTLTPDEAVRADLSLADLIMPSLDAATQPVFEAINRPAAGLLIADVIEGLVALRREFSGKLWLEILLVAGMNDSEAELNALIAATERIAPDTVQLNTVVRPPTESTAEPLSPERLNEIARRFTVPVETLTAYHGAGTKHRSLDLYAEIIAYLGRRPATLTDLATMLGESEETISAHLEKLIVTRRVLPPDSAGGYFRVKE